MSTLDISPSDFLSYLSIRKSLSKNSIRHIRIRLNVIDRWLTNNNKELNSSTIEEFLFSLKEEGRSNACINTYIFTIRYLADYYKHIGLPYSFAEELVSLKKSKSDIQILTLEEVERLLQVSLVYGRFRGKDTTEHLDAMYSAFTMFLAYTGCRFSEASELTIEKLDIPNGKATFIHTKNREVRTVNLPPELKDKLAPLVKDRSPEEYVFINAAGHCVRAQEYQYDLRLRALEAGITKRTYPHLLRHTFATHLLSYTGADVTEVATILGHKDIQMTYSTYLHLANESIRIAHFNHPLIRKTAPPTDVLHSVASAVKKFKLDKDNRFSYRIDEGESSFSFTMFVR